MSGHESTAATPHLIALIELLGGTLANSNAHRVATLLQSINADLTRTNELDDDRDIEWLETANQNVRDERVDYWLDQLTSLANRGVRVIVAGTPDYPTNLQLIANAPPLIFVRGTLSRADDRAIAVVGTRQATNTGRRRAARIASELARRDVTVVSGLASGIDAAAHRAALDAGGRTIAVFGTGIDWLYPVENRKLADDIVKSGACVSQFWPTQTGAQWTFPTRNVVTSGLSLGTVVVEASRTSGARLQATEARKHGRRLFLLRGLVTDQPWAAELQGLPGVHVVDSVDDVTDMVDLELGVPVGASPTF